MRKLKYLVLGLAFSACMVSLTGCGSDDDNNGSNQPGTSRETTTNRETSTNRETESNGNNNNKPGSNSQQVLVFINFRFFGREINNL